MKTYLDNLRPAERRLVVGVGAMLFVVFNLWFVVPHFSDWDRVKFRMNKAQNTLKTFSDEFSATNRYMREIKRLQGEGADVAQEEQKLHFATTVQTMAAQAGVPLTSSTHVTEQTNQFFVKLSQQVSAVSKEQQLVSFLFNLGSGASVIRVQELGLRPDAPRMQLNANMKLVANYQKKTPARTAPPGGPRRGPTAGAGTPTSPPNKS